MKNLVVFTLIALVISMIMGCAENDSTEIAILKYVTHPALDELESAFYTRMDSLLKSDASFKDYRIVKYNANGNAQTAKSIAESFNRKNVALILAIATPSAIAVSRTKSNIPLIYGAVADPEGAKIIPSVRATGIQNAGENIIFEALSFIKKAFPKAKKLGTIYNPKEQNSVFVQNHVKSIAEKLGFDLRQVTASSSGQFTGITEALCKQVDVIYSANDNTVNAGISAIVNICNKKKTPFIIGDLSTLPKGPLFAIGLEYKSMGVDLADMSFKVVNGVNISSLKPRPAPLPEIWMNKETQSVLNYMFPDSSVLNMVNRIVE